MNGSVLVWGWSGTEWLKVLVDAAGHLQVDVLSSALPAGAPTYGQQNINNQLTSLSYTVLNTRLPSALDTDSLKVKEQGTPEKHVYGYDGSNWQTLLVESSTLKNLRVKLYDGANGIDSQLVDTGMTTERGLVVAAQIYGRAGADNVNPIRGEPSDADNRGTSTWGLEVHSRLYGFDGSTWDRLRSYGTGILKTGRAEVGLLTARMTAVGQVGATGARKLYWLHENGSAANAVYELADATSAGQTVVFDHFSTSKEGHMVTFDPPMEFSNGIYLETVTNITSIVFGYL
ncbi:hypothetical protein LCGC14_1322920 [marine sediment metagenome]|uniref:Uncharacterized protein n=1 Tax=marine sediment metagenome TaxID=412755 RepID=A0A0F9KJG2_9ZZZZ